MDSYKKLNNIVGWVVFFIAFAVYFLSAERTGSLWDCGEFITGAYKLQVVHPPGAPVFLIVGRFFTFLAEMLSDNPENIAFAVNLMSGLCSAFAAMFVCWVTTILGKLALVGREEEDTSEIVGEGKRKGVLDSAEQIAVLGAGAVAGLATAFSTSIWFSAVEGEVYSMSTFFTAMTLWTVIKWYNLPDKPQNDRWLVLSVYLAGLSMGVHLLSLLTFPALALFYYFKKYKTHNLVGMGIAAIIGIAFIAFIQVFIIVGIPKLWSWMELMMVNGFGLPVHSGIIPLVLIIAGLLIVGLKIAHQRQNAILQQLLVATTLVVLAFSTLGIVVIRANADTPINMNSPSDAMRLIPYLNREQYGERPLLKGPHFNAPVREVETEDRYGLVDGKYEIVDKKASYVYDSKDKMLFPRMGHQDEARKALYARWMGGKKGNPSMGDNLKFFFEYQVGWMYWRYFMWNFSGRQNGEQGFYTWDKTSGNWVSGIPLIDTSIRGLPSTSEMPSSLKHNQAHNKYYMLPFIFGLIGMFFHIKRRPNDFIGLLTLFIITGLGIIVYSNQPPNEPRERDYVLVGSFFTYCIWMGMGVLGIFSMLRSRMNGKTAAPIALALVMIAPILMGTQNFDDHTRRHHSGSRDYASNFLNSCEPNSIIFTYGDNDTYPLWYAQEVEGIRTDVRVVNLSLIAVDWYINQQRRKINDSPPIKMSIPRTSYRGMKRSQLFFLSKENPEKNLAAAVKFMGDDNPLNVSNRTLESYAPTRKFSIPVDRNRVISNGTVSPADAENIVPKVTFTFPRSNYIQKGELALLDIVASNAFERPIYFAVTCRESSLLGLGDYLQLEGMSLKLVPLKNKGETRYGMVGKGRVNTDAVYNNIMTKFRFGNFDKERLFVDRSYGPSVQTTRVAVMRTVDAMIKKGDKKRAVELLDKFFTGFPHMNFPFDAHSLLLMQMYLEAGGFDSAKPHLDTMAKETQERLHFYTTMSDAELKRTGYWNDSNTYGSIMVELLRMSQSPQMKERFPKWGDELSTMFAAYK